MTDRTANLLGALALAVTDKIEQSAHSVLGRGGETPAAVVVIGYGSGLTNNGLRRILRLSHPGTVRLVDRLVGDGLVERRPGRDSREIALHLTNEGIRVREALLAKRISTIASMLTVLSAAEQSDLANLLSELLSRPKSSELERYTLCRMCDDRVCSNCPLPTVKAAQSLAK